MKIDRAWLFLLLVAGWFGIIVFVSAPVFAESDPVVPAEKSKLAVEEQQKLATELFYGFYEKSRNQDGEIDQAQVVALYNRIIDECPDVPLAQESYWRLIELALDSDKPGRTDRSLDLFREFKRKYPQSPLMRVVSEVLARFLYQQGQWQALADVIAGVSDNESQLKKSPLQAFYFAEAKFHLGDRQAALTIYQSIVTESPNSRMATIAKERINRIEKND